MYQSKYKNSILSESFLNGLYDRSTHGITDKNEIKYIEKYISYIEDFVQDLQSIGVINSENKEQVVSRIETINIIRSLPMDERGDLGLTSYDNVFVNPSLRGNGILTGEERTRLYCYHELGNVIQGMYEEQRDKAVYDLAQKYNLSPKDRDLLKMGFQMIGDATIQEIAEGSAYRYAQKARPGLRSYKQYSGKKDGYLFGEHDVVTNFDYYGELEVPAIMFARTVRGIGADINLRTDRSMMTQLAKRSFEPDFIDALVEEYTSVGHEANLAKILLRMGVIKDASYGLFEKGKYPDSMILAERAYIELDAETKLLADWRPRIRKKGQACLEDK